MKISKLFSWLLFGANLKFSVVEDDGGAINDNNDEVPPDDETPVEENINSDNNDEVPPDDETGEDELTVSIDGEEPPEEDETANAPQWVKELRKSHRESQKRIKELEAQLQGGNGEQQQILQLGEKPTLEGCDYDADKYEADYSAWVERKRQIEEQTAKRQQEQEKTNLAWQEKLNGYTKSKTELKVKDFDDAEEFIKDNFSITQQGIIVKGCKNPALVVYALGKNPKKAKELAAINDPVEYAFAVANLENQLKVTNRKSAPPPEKTVRTGGAPVSGSVDSQLERLRADAEKTGDYSKVMAYKRQLKAKAK